MVSVYLRNLFLNQFIVLPMMLAMIALPRLVLLLFTQRSSGKMIALAREWLEGHHGWPVHAVLWPASRHVVRAEARRLFRAVDRQAAPRVEKGIDDPRPSWRSA